MATDKICRCGNKMHTVIQTRRYKERVYQYEVKRCWKCERAREKANREIRAKKVKNYSTLIPKNLGNRRRPE
jgi:hypothetical protein